MNKFRNKGVSFFELVIAVAIFAILVIPITSQLIQALKTSDKATKAQTKYEFAENLMENIKNSDTTSFFSDNVINDDYLNKVSETSSVKKYPTNGMYSDTVSGTNEKGEAKTASYSGCIVTGSTKIQSGNKAKTYYYAIDTDNKSYAENQVADSKYSNPNDSTLALIESLDASEVALINGTIGNYDMTVTNAFMSKKLDILKIGDRTRWEQYTKQQADIVAFPNDTVTRVIEISVSSEDAHETDATTGNELYNYTVSCKLRYKDNSNVVLKDGPYAGKTIGSVLTQEITYTPYTQTFKATELPSIYLMYNPCLYNGNYMANDNIILDTSGLVKQTVKVLDRNGKVVQENNTDKTENGYPQVNLFVVETAEQYSEQAAESYAMISVAQGAAEEKVMAQANMASESIANGKVPDKASDPDAWQVAYDKAYKEEYPKAKEKYYDKEYAEAYTNVSNAVNKNTSNTWLTKYNDALTKISNQYLVNTSTIRSRSRSSVTFIGKNHSGENLTELEKYVNIYHNFVKDDYSGKNMRTLESKVLFKNYDPITGSNTNMYTISNADDLSTADIDENQFKYITDAVTSASPLYNVKIYISEEPIADASSTYSSLKTKLSGMKPLVTGTKGGN